MIRDGYRFPAGAKPVHGPHAWINASAGEGRSEKIMRQQNSRRVRWSRHDALFNRNLQPEGSLEEAFLDARVTIGQGEARDCLTPSNLKGHFGSALVAKLAQVYGVSHQVRAVPNP